MEHIKLSGSFYVNENGILGLLRGEKKVRIGLVWHGDRNWNICVSWGKTPRRKKKSEWCEETAGSMPLNRQKDMGSSA